METHHVLGHHCRRSSHPVLGLAPISAAHPGEAGSFTAGVPLHGCQLVGRNVQTIFAGVGDNQVVPLDPCDGSSHKTVEPPDAVAVMDDEVTFGEISIGGRRLGPTGDTAVGAAATGHLLFADDAHPQPGEDEAVMDAFMMHRRSGRRARLQPGKVQTRLT